MGWGSGSTVMSPIIETAKKYVPAEVRKDFYKEVILALEDSDWDTQSECIGQDPIFDEALKELHPTWDWSWCDGNSS